MNKSLKLLVTMGFCGLAIFVLACVLHLSIIGIIGLVMLFGSAVAAVVCNVITGYNPAEP